MGTDTIQKIVLISLSTPTPNNVRAASALPYHLIKAHWDSGSHFFVYSFNINDIELCKVKEIEAELGISICILPRPKWMLLMMRLKLLVLRLLLRSPLATYHRLSASVVQAIKAEKPDVVWIYGEEIAWLAKQFNDFRCVVTMPDCESLFYHRLLGKRFAVGNCFQVMKSAYAYYQYLHMERNMLVKGVRYHFVGMEDARFFRKMNPKAEVLFLPHPLYDYRNKNIRFHHPRIKLLIAGRNDFYMAEEVEELFSVLSKIDYSCLEGQSLLKYFEWTFLGKGWENIVEKLLQLGFDARHIKFAPDYIEELQRHDIQITPISVGTGTKGKVLDAIANGLLEIGTIGALENIAVEDGVSCIIYQNANELIKILKDISQNPKRYEEMARLGMVSVRQSHDRVYIARKLFS